MTLTNDVQRICLWLDKEMERERKRQRDMKSVRVFDFSEFAVHYTGLKTTTLLVYGIVFVCIMRC